METAETRSQWGGERKSFKWKEKDKSLLARVNIEGVQVGEECVKENEERQGKYSRDGVDVERK